MKISNKTFYNRHNLELERFINIGTSLHIVNSLSKNKINEKRSQKLYFDTLNEEDSMKNLKLLNSSFDVVVLTDIFESLDDNYNFLETVRQLLNNNGKLILTSVNTRYKIVFSFFEKIGLKDKNLQNSYIHNQKIKNFITGLGFEYINTYSKQIIPFNLFGLGYLVNKILEVLLYKFNFGIKTYTIFRIKKENFTNYTKSILVPAKNEAGNLQPLIDRVPKFQNCEIIISIGDSDDDTLTVAKKIRDENKVFDIIVFEQTGKGKANAIWESFDYVSGDVIAILDADISVDPESLVEFFKILESNNADFVNGTRLVYDMEKQAMRFINKIGNRTFQIILSFILKIKLTDSLCGTKVFKKSFIEGIYWWQKKFNLIDPFCDFDLLFSAAYSGQKIVDFPVKYKSRTYGTTQISRFKDGFKLFTYLFYSSMVFITSRQNLINRRL